ncbi:hypothetical protein [Chitinophaga alhagiae]|uniref:hypothetical protein n=1 Tax=Chitinophaga alhagiae TaxID=2203219 RepID=UPI000E5A693E|nr:hypothetical protein [Chitinophaga alhagiae]
MKKILPCLALLVVTLCTFAQSVPQHDVVLKLNGGELTGKVVKISDNDVDFVYANETLIYNIKKADIMKITFGSGRIEVFNKPPEPAGNQQAQGGPGLEEHHNKVAVLPFTFVRDGQPSDDAVSEEVQNECFAYMNKHAGVFTILNPRTTNALLIKAGVTKTNIKGYTMEDLCGILGVEYVVDGMVSMNKTTQTTYQSNTGSSSSKNDNNKDRRYNSSSYGTATQNYQTKLNLAIYNDKGANVYEQDRTSFWNTQDAYKSTLEYLLKRSPLYSK